MFVEYCISAIVLGIVVAIPPGSVTIVCCQRALRYGFANSLVFTFGSCVSDVFYISLVYFGVAEIISSNAVFKIVLWIICGSILIVLGTVSLATAKTGHSGNGLSHVQSGVFATFISGVLITLSNPLTIIGWLAIAGNFFLIWNARFPLSKDLGIMTIGLIMAGVLTWFIPLTFLVSKLRTMINEKVKTYLLVFSSIALLLFGLAAFYYAIAALVTGA